MFFLTFEGAEASGKTTFSRLLENELKKRGYKVFLTSEPSSFCFLNKIKKMLLSAKKNKLCYKTQLLLLLAQRIEHLDKVILPKLKEGFIVISDRYFDSTIAYQVFWQKTVSLPDINYLQNKVFAFKRPDITFFLYTSKAKALARLEQRKKSNFLDKELNKSFTKVITGYNFLCKNEPERIKKIVNDSTKNKVLTKIMKIIDVFLNNKINKN